jgi:hypothetical protein
LRASHVTYYKRQKTIEAWENVSLENSSGQPQHFDAVLLKIDNRVLTPIKLLQGKEHSAF